MGDFEKISSAYFTINPRDVLRKIDEVASKLPEELIPVTLALRENLALTLTSALMPQTIAWGNAHHRKFESVFRGELKPDFQIALRKATGELPEDTPPVSPEAREEALRNARLKFAELCKTEAVKEEIYADVRRELVGYLSSEDIRVATEQLLWHGAVSCWASFEVFLTDLAVTCINNTPRLIEKLVGVPQLREYLPLRGIPIETLIQHNFSIENAMGNVLFATQRLDNIKLAQEIFKAICDDDQVQRALANRKLYELNQRRHLIVHNRGIVDKSYLKRTASDEAVGEKIHVSPADLESYVVTVVSTATTLLSSIAINEK